jgi:SNF2 family DNA or RNA helicase
MLVTVVVNGKMRSYQLESLQFFINLYRNGIQGGILADEMVGH